MHLARLFFCFFSIFFLSFSGINNLFAEEKKYPKDFPKCYEKAISKKDYCPLEHKFGHKLIIVDFTTKHEKFQRDWVLNTALGKDLVENTKPFHKISFVRIDQNSATEQKPFFSKCKMKTGKGELSPSNLNGTNKKCEGKLKIRTLYQNFVLQVALATGNFCLIGDCDLTHKKWIDDHVEKKVAKAKEKLTDAQIRSFRERLTKKIKDERFFPPRYTSPPGSYIYETIIEVLRSENFDFSNKYKERELIIASDLVQISKRFNLSHTKGYCRPKPALDNKKRYCGNLKGLLKNKTTKNYLEQTKLKDEQLENLKVKVLFMNHNYSCETNMKAAESMHLLWKELFDYMGIKNVEWVWQLDPNKKASC